MFSQLIVVFAILSVASAKLFNEDAKFQKYMWENFKREHAKNYASMDEENRRFNIFIENLQMADLRNERELKNGGNEVHGITKFSDMSQVEFESNFLTADAKMKTNSAPVDNTVRPEPNVNLGLVDWSGKLTTPVKDQGYCGSCWAFSATEQIESDYMREHGATYVLSAEQITQCTTGSSGCNGGWTESAYTYVQREGGLETESDYPYTSYQGITGQCHDGGDYKVGITGYSTLKGESNMASYVQSTGPLSVCLDASSWNSYHGGIMTSCGNRVDHCVQAVGVDTSIVGGYWKVRNSWGTSWGESGYIRLAYGQNTCDITNDPTYVKTVKA
mmetsp:Transcript_72972/g.202482  ORF Transcript_72972/g.202482 Transcript_72972/m.202482 type:complete len:331 (+) Transcript_72972:45-1037(+)